MKKNIFLIIDNSKPPESKYLGKVVEYMNIRGVEYKVVSSIKEFEDISNKVKIIGAISTGSDYRVSTGENIDLSNTALESLECPILGICYGFQSMSDFYGVKIDSGEEKCGNFNIDWHDEEFWMFKGLDLRNTLLRFCFHDYPATVPIGFKTISEIDGKISGIANDSLKRYGILFHPEEEYQTYSILDRFIERCISSSKNDMKYISKYESFLKKSRYIKMYEYFTEKRISIFDQDIKKLLPEEIHIENTYGKHTLKKKDVMLNGDLIQIAYHHDTAAEKNDVSADGEPDYLCFDIHTLKENDGTEANGDNLRLNIDITYGDAMIFSFTIEAPNKVNPHHYTGIGSMHEEETKFHFEDETLEELITFFNRFSDNYNLTKDDFKFLDSDPNSYKPHH
jgi:GMP synthase-like glutamine amidotransferase